MFRMRRSINSSLIRLSLSVVLALGAASFAVPFAAWAQADSKKDPSALSGGMARGEKNREEWQKVAAVFEALNLKAGSAVADVGAGDGFFTVRLARAVGPTGRVVAVDVNKKRLKQLRKRAKKGKLSNIQVVEGTEDDPKLEPNSLDAILISNAYHHLEHYQAELAHMKRALKPGGKLVILDYQRSLIDGKPRNENRHAQTRRHGIKADVVQRDLEEAGFEVADRRDDFIRLVTIEWIIIASPASPAGPENAGN